MCRSDDVEQYFNYMGCLAVEGTYDRMYALLDGATPALRRLQPPRDCDALFPLPPPAVGPALR